jgi:HSP20 family protein
MFRSNEMYPAMRSLISSLDDGLQVFQGDLAPGSGTTRMSSALMAGFPDIDCWTEDRSLVFRAELPGFDPGKIDIDVHENTLTLKGVKAAAERSKEARLHFSEIRHGKFERKFTLPDNVDTEKIDASFHHGVLEIRLQLLKEKTPRKVKIKTVQD